MDHSRVKNEVSKLMYRDPLRTVPSQVIQSILSFMMRIKVERLCEKNALRKLMLQYVDTKYNVEMYLEYRLYIFF